MRLASLGIVLICASCIESATSTCSDGRVCAAGTVCDDRHHLCVLAEQLGACAAAGLDELAACTIAGEPGGYCRDGDCLPTVCGDGLVTGAERCDPADDLTATTTCGALDYYQGATIACSAECRYDTRTCSEFCGDGMVNGPEQCDGAPPTETCVDLGFEHGYVDCSAKTCAPDLATCAYLDWRVTPTGVDYGIADFAEAGGVGFAVVPNLDGAEGGTVLRFGADKRWTRIGEFPLGANGWMWSVYADSPTSVYVSGTRNNGGFVRRWDGTSWTEELFVATDSEIFDLTGAGGHVFAFGYSGVWHRDAGTWAFSPWASGDYANQAWARAADDVYVARDSGLLHYDGTSWSAVAGAPANPVAVHGFGASELVVIGDAGNGQRIHVYNGATWTELATPGTEPHEVLARSATEIYALIYTSTSFRDQVFRYDGTAWRSLSEGTARLIDEPKVLGAVGPDPSDLIVGAETGRVWRYQGSSFVELPGQTLSSPQPSSLWTSGVHAFVGQSNRAYHYDGATWENFAFAVGKNIAGIWGSAPDDVWLIGYNAAQSSLYHYSGTWSGTAVFSAAAPLQTITGSAADDIVVFGYGGQILEYRGQSWQVVVPASGSGGPAIAAYCRPTGECLAVGSDGSVLRRADRASGWTSAPVGPIYMEDVWAADTGDWYAVAALDVQRGVWRFDGATWTRVLDVPLTRIRGTAPDDILATGRAGSFHFDGQRWTPVQLSALVDDPLDLDISGLGAHVLTTSALHRLDRLTSW